MPKPRRKGAVANDVRKAERRKRAVEASLAGDSVAVIAEREKCDASTIYADLKEACQAALSGEVREAWLMRNLKRREEVIRINRPGMLERDPQATALYLKALDSEDKMLGVRDGVVNNIEFARDGSKSKIPGDFVLNFIGPDPSKHPTEVWNGEPEPASQGGAQPYSARVHEFPRLVDDRQTHGQPSDQTFVADASEPTPNVAHEHLPKVAIKRYGAADLPPAEGDVNARSFMAPRDATGAATEFDLPPNQRPGVNIPESGNRTKHWMS